MKKCVVTEFQNQMVSVLFHENREISIDVYRSDRESFLDRIYVGRVKDIASHIQAAFIDIQPDTACYFSLEENKHPIFLNRKNTDKVCQGDLILVQVKKEAVKTKAPTVSSVLELSGALVVLTTEEPKTVHVSKKIGDRNRREQLKELILPFANGSYGFIVRTDAEHAPEAEILAEAGRLAGQMDAILQYAPTRSAFSCMYESEPELCKDIRNYKLGTEDELITDIESVYETVSGMNKNFQSKLYQDQLLPLYKLYRIEQILRNAAEKKVWLKSGGYLILEPTETLTVIDVNSGKYETKSRDKEATFLKINLEAAAEIARQLRLRNISGIILIDFINMKSRESHDVLKHTLKELLEKDPVKTSFVDVTGLELYEITRKKIKKSLRERIADIHETGKSDSIN